LAWSAKDIPDLAGRVAVVSGGNGGLGLETCRALAAHGAQVVMGARNLDKAGEAARSIRETVPDARLEVRQLGLGSLAAIAEFASAVRASHPAVQMLFAGSVG
jgi:NAD(P)-dependent dehydrogenase (short-subunit alcohol dehydrogenase family)